MLRIIPTPSIFEIRRGSFTLLGAQVLTEGNLDPRVIKAISRLEIPDGDSGENTIIVSHGEEGEGYRLTVSEHNITIEGDGAAGAFYGLQSLRQLIMENGDAIPCCYIEDKPDLLHRGFYHDISRGRVPTLKKLKSIADTLAFYKINSLQLYVEDAFTFRELDGIITPDNALTPEEIKELDKYCKERFIDLVPSMSSFGHLYTLLQSEKYNHICELKGHVPTKNYWLERQWHHTVDVYNPETIEVIGSMLRQFIPLFSSEYFNICCDETMDLVCGTNNGCDKGEAYFYHVEKLIDIVRSYGKRVMLWGDECMARPDMAKERLPEDVIVLNWCYRREVAEWIPKMFWERGFTQICCTGTSCWDNFIENVFISQGNISSFAAHAKKYGTLGILNTNWGDFGHVCPFNCNLYGLLLGAEKSWNVESDIDCDYEKAASFLLYGVREFNMAETLRRLAKAASSCSWSDFVIWHSATHLEGKNVALEYGYGRGGEYTAEDVTSHIDICNEEIARLESLGRSDAIICDLLLSARAISLMNRLKLCINGVENYTDKNSLQRDFDLWLKEYSAAWLRDDKPSQLWRIEEFIAHITE